MPPEVVRLVDGDGGAAALRLVREEILTRLGNPYLDALEDGSWLPWQDRDLVVTTDSFIVQPFIFPGGDIGRLAVCGSANDLTASGAVPRFMSLSLILSDGFPLDTLRRVLSSIAVTARSGGIQIVCGDTKVLDMRLSNQVFINTTAFGAPVDPSRRYALQATLPGDVLVITGSVGDHGLAILSAREGLGFESRVQSDCAVLHPMLEPLLRDFTAIHSLRDPTRGGLLNVLFDLVESAHLDIHVERESIPVQHEVRFACEMLGIDPLELVNEGKMLLTVAPEQAESVLARLRAHPLGRDSALIGQATAPRVGAGRLIIRERGIQKAIARPEGSRIPRLC